MNVLAFDTSYAACSAAARAQSQGGPVRIAHRYREMETGHAEALVPMIGEVIAEAGIEFCDLQRIVVAYGPGTFTGVRTAVAAARALALATGAEIVAVSSLWAIAAAMTNAAAADNAATDGVMVVMDARKGQLYVQVIDAQGRPQTEPILTEPEIAAALLPQQRLMVVGNAADQVLAAADSQNRTNLRRRPAGLTCTDTAPNAIHLLDAALHSSIAGPLLPLYLRPPDAKPQADKSLPWSSP